MPIKPESPSQGTSPLPESIRKTSLTLGLFALCAAILLGTVYLLTADKILAQQLAAERNALSEILPASLHDNDLLTARASLGPDAIDQVFDNQSLLELTAQRNAYIAKFNGQMSGIILPVETHQGYSGTIIMLVGILADGTISGVRVLEHRETPGLGDKIDLDVSSWILNFDGKAINNPAPSRWQVLKDGGEFDQLTGATITSRAVLDGVKRALDFFQGNLDNFENF